MNKIKNIYFNDIVWGSEAIKDTLISNGFIYIEDLSKVTYVDIIKIRKIHIGTLVKIQGAMKLYGVNFSDSKWLHKREIDRYEYQKSYALRRRSESKKNKG